MRGKSSRRFRSLLGKSLDDLERSGGRPLCRSGALIQFRFGTLCGDAASFHDRVTIELDGDRVARIWSRAVYNDAFCDL